MDGELDFRLLFEESPDVLLVLLPDAPRFTMVAATQARWRATHTLLRPSAAACSKFSPTIPMTRARAARVICGRRWNAC